MANENNTGTGYVHAAAWVTLCGLCQQEIEGAYEQETEEWDRWTVGLTATVAGIHALTVTKAELKKVTAAMADVISDLRTHGRVL